MLQIRLNHRIIPMAGLAALAGISYHAQSGLAQQAATGTPEGKAARPLDPRVQQRAL